MLDDNAYLHWLDQCGFSDTARTLLTDIRRSPPEKPVRLVPDGQAHAQEYANQNARPLENDAI